MNIFFFLLMLIVMVILYAGLYVLIAYLCAMNEVLQFYVSIPANHFAIVAKTTTKGTPVRLLYNSKGMKLIKADGFPLGKLVPLSEEGEDLQKLSWIEEKLGIWFIGIPFLRRLYVQDDSEWNRVEMANKESKDTFVYKRGSIHFFSISNLYGFIMPNLELGGKIGQEKQRIPVIIYTQGQATIENPYLAIIHTKWMPGSQNMLIESIRSSLGLMTEDDLIGEAEAGLLVKKMVDRVETIRKEFGVILSKLTYVDYDLTGSDEEKGRMEKSGTQLVVDTREAQGTEKKLAAEQTPMREQGKILLELIEKLVEERKLTTEQATMVAMQMLRSQGIQKTKLSTLVESGSGMNMGMNINSGNQNSQEKRGG